MRAILVCVDYADLLAVTLPYNRHHFEAVYIVTDKRCQAETEAAAFRGLTQEQRCGVIVLTTDLFYADGAAFNKWRALEWGLDQMGRHGWLCIMDADILWPKSIKLFGSTVDGRQNLLGQRGRINVNFGNIYTPLRRIWAEWPDPMIRGGVMYNAIVGKQPPLPLEQHWSAFPIHRNTGEWAGYSQIFHANDPVLGPPPWHETDWIHAGGADSFFQRKWKPENKIRPPFECLHLGPCGENWFGRTEEGRRRTKAIWQRRRDLKLAGRDPFEEEKLR